MHPLRAPEFPGERMLSAQKLLRQDEMLCAWATSVAAITLC